MRLGMDAQERVKEDKSTDTVNLRIPIALLLAPVIPYVVVALIFQAVGVPLPMMQGGVGILLSTAAACSISLVVGGIAYLVLRRFRPIGLAECLIAGVALGLIFGGVVGLVVGPISAGVFWKVGLRAGKAIALQ